MHKNPIDRPFRSKEDVEMERALVDHCRDGLAHYKYPRWFHFVDDLPKTATGKIQRFRLRAVREDF